MDSQEQETWVKRAQKGDKNAFIHLVQTLEMPLYNVAKSILKKDEDCADAMQESVLRAYKGLTSLEHTRYFKTWLFRILINECNIILRKRARTVAMADPPASIGGSAEADHIDLRDSIDHLDETSRTIVILHYYQDLPLQQIADILEMSGSAVKTRLHRARKILYLSLADPAERKLYL
ncbi:sigma-70 family RNA polymerase sigma factor [Paenibacillus albidus]|uniref:sigma-70 family RNA polymerase sigma factor n=1 Tax=Paenibacillus albidus TaxID=2041023 RepID=UPI0020359166|nr:sigma-70 family RNA polymerase sigma factor [Paenibacillus albidus]